MDDYRQLFEAAPDAYLVLRPERDFTIIAATDAYLSATMTQRDEVVGRPLFEIFTQKRGSKNEQSLRLLRESLDRTLSTRSAQQLAVRHYLRRSNLAGEDSEPGHWNVRNVPVIGASREIKYIVHRIESASAHEPADAKRRHYEDSHEAILAQIKAADLKIAARDRELARTQDELATQEQRLRETKTRLEAAAQVGGIATWIWELESDRVFADENLTRWYRLPPGVANGGPFAAYLQPVHTDDVALVSETLDRALSSDEAVQVEYRIPGDSTPWRWVVARARIERNENRQHVRHAHRHGDDAEHAANRHEPGHSRSLLLLVNGPGARSK